MRSLGMAIVCTALLATPAAAQDYSLRADADRVGLLLGSAIQARHLEDAPFAALVKRHVNTLTFENEAKWGTIHPERDRYDFSGADRVAEFARANGMKMRGHVLIWHVQNPAWLTSLSPTRDEALAILRDHIFTVVGHFRDRFPGLIVEWDVVNEGIDNDGTRRQSVWQRWIGDDYVDFAFRWAREAAGPDVELFYNDFFDAGMIALAEGLGESFDDGDDPGPQFAPGATGALPCDAVVKCAEVKKLVTGLKQRGVPIDGVGFQAHLASPSPSDHRALTAWVGELGLRWAITELDVPDPSDGTPTGQQHQADAYTTVVGACLEDPACSTVVTWGLSDRYTWWANISSGLTTRALHFDRDLQALLAADALHELLATATPQGPLGGGEPGGQGRRCLARRSPVGRWGIGRVRLGYTRAQLASRVGPPPRRRGARAWSWCVKGGGGKVAAVFGRRGRAVLVLTTAPRHGNRGLRPGAPSRVGRGVRRGRPATRLIGVRGGRVRFLAVADPVLAGHRRKLARQLRLARRAVR